MLSNRKAGAIKELDISEYGDDYKVNWTYFFNGLGTDIIVPTYYETKYGFAYFKQLFTSMKHKPLACNVELKFGSKQVTDVIDTYRIIKVNDRKILFVGAICNDDNLASKFFIDTPIIDAVK